jgi:hypothetical protein
MLHLMHNVQQVIKILVIFKNKIYPNIKRVRF